MPASHHTTSAILTAGIFLDPASAFLKLIAPFTVLSAFDGLNPHQKFFF